MSRMMIIQASVCMLTACALFAQDTVITPERAAELESAGLTVILHKDGGEEQPSEAAQESDGELTAAEEDRDSLESAVVEPAPEAEDFVAEESEEAEEAEDAALDEQAQAQPPPATSLIAFYSFDENLEPDHTAGFGAAVKFERQTPAYANDAAFEASQPRLVEGKFGKGILLEEERANLFSRNQSDIEEGADGFECVNGADISVSKDDRWQGSQSLRIATPGNAEEEGFSTQVEAQRVIYNGNDIVPALYVASLYAKGEGFMRMTLKDPGGEQDGVPFFFELSDEWRRFSCHFSFDFKPMTIGRGLQSTWQTNLPADILDSAQLQLICATTDKQKADFLADGLLLERRQLVHAGQELCISPLTWMPGGANMTQEMLSLDTSDDFFNEWKRNGTISFWFKPCWDSRDGTRATILRMEPGDWILDHANARIRMPNHGVSLVPYEWQDFWHHLAITWDRDGNHILYVDGYDYPSQKPFVNTSAVLSFFSGNTSPNGVIDELALFQGALTPEQVKEMAFKEQSAKP